MLPGSRLDVPEPMVALFDAHRSQLLDRSFRPSRKLVEFDGTMAVVEVANPRGQSIHNHFW